MAAQRRPRAEWEQLVEERAQSGQSVRAFAAVHDLNRHTPEWWRWRMRTEAPPVTGSFVPVIVGATEAESDPDEVCVTLPNGVALRFAHRLDMAGLRDLVAVLGEL